MSVTAVFVQHEVRTQLRSSRFSLLTLVYLVVSTGPAVMIALEARRIDSLIGSGSWTDSLMLLQPMATAVFAALLSVDALSRERDDGSFAVLSLMPMSNGGYLLRRWLAVVAIIVPLTLVPEIVAFALALSRRSGPLQWTFFVFEWLFHIAPLAVIASALALALGTIAGRTMLAAAGGIAIFSIVLVWGNDFLARFRMHVDGAAELLGFSPLRFQQALWHVKGYRGAAVPSEAPYDVRGEFIQAVPTILLTLAITALLFGIAATLLRRSRPDLRPLRARDDHPFRTTIGFLNRLRQDFAPDPSLGWRDHLVVGLGAAVAFLSVASLLHAQTSFARLAAHRYDAEVSESPQPTSLAVIATRISVKGSMAGDGSLSTRAELTLRNDGPTPVSLLAFSLNPAVSVIGAGSSAGKVAIGGHEWDRLSARLDPSLMSGQTRTIVFFLRGTPAAVEFALRGSGSFLSRYSRFLKARDSSEFSDLSRSDVLPAISRRRIALSGPDIMPVLRYTSWKLTTSEDRFEKSVVRELHLPVSEIDIDLSLPAGTYLADSCGNGWQGRAAGTCSFSAVSYQMIGGPLQPVAISPSATLVVLPLHRELAAIHGPAIVKSLELAARAWPELVFPSKTIFMERPTEEDEQWYGDFSPAMAQRSIGSAGAVQLLPELMLIRRRALPPTVMAASLIAHALRARRTVALSERLLFSRLYELLAIFRVGERKRSAVVPGGGMAPDREPLLPSPQYSGEQRLRCVLLDIEARAGADQMVRGVNDFLREPGEGTTRQLLDAIGRRGGISLDRVYSDFFTGSDLPELTLEEVSFTHRGEQWLITGTVENRGTGEVICPVVLRTDFESINRAVRIDSHQKVSFSMTTSYQPRVVQLDPDRICYRYAALGTVDHVEYRGPS